MCIMWSFIEAAKDSWFDRLTRTVRSYVPFGLSQPESL
jgi:hypothetical protein